MIRQQLSIKLLFVWGLFGLLLNSQAATTDSLPKISPDRPIKKVIIIPVEEQVDFGLLAFLKRAVEEAKSQKPDAIVFKVNTYGGELHSAFEIVDLFTSIDFCSTYAFVHQKAISAGALVSLACNNLAMGNGTTIGDCAPITQSQEGVVVLGEKIQSPLRAKFRTLAERNGYPSLPAEAMVTMEMGVVAAFPEDTTRIPEFFTVKQWGSLSAKDKKPYRRHKVVVEEGQLLTMTDQEAEQYGFSQGSFNDLEAFLKLKGWEVTGELNPSWSEAMVRTVGKFAPILMLIGLGALYMEFKTPGFSIFGIIGLISLGIVFGSKYAVGLAHHTELLLLLLGATLFLLEIYLFPGTLFLAGTGLILIMAGLVLSMQGFNWPDPEFPWEMQTMVQNIALILAMAMLAVLVPLIVFRFVLPNLPRRISVISQATMKDAHAVLPDRGELTAGQTGRTKTALRPAGKAYFGGKVYEAYADTGFIEAEREIRIISLIGNKITVREITDNTGSAVGA